MTPAAGECVLRHVGDRIKFTLESEAAGQAFLRTNLGRAPRLNAEILQEYREELARWELPPAAGPETNRPRGLAWRDIPMQFHNGLWELDLALVQVGFFSGKAYLVNEQGRQVWPHGSNVGITVHPNEYRSANTIYCAFTRMFGETKTALSTAGELDGLATRLDKMGYAVIPPSGKLRDLTRELPHIFNVLGCRILHLLPVNPTPTTYARFGRYGSPYACQDLMEVDKALVEFDRRTTGVDQFRELTYAAHSLGGQVLLDIVINHTGWGSKEQENHPDWFLRNDNGVFVSPGAWGTIWEDLVELDHRRPLSWDYLADVFLTWCRRGVDGFRCDAGYKIPAPAWRYITAKVRQEFPKALFLLEGLGGAWEATEDLLTRGGMQWAYSELFQNYSPIQVSGYLDHSISKSEHAGVLVHYSETHDNDRLAAKGRAWSLLRNQLCALTSHQGAFGFTCGVEWLAPEKINVHSCRGMAWGNPENLVEELSRLNRLLADHPCFFDGAKLTRLSSPDSKVYALHRISADTADHLLVLVNLEPDASASIFLEKKSIAEIGSPAWDLLTESKISGRDLGQNWQFDLSPGQSLALAPALTPRGIAGDQYRKLRARHAWAIEMAGQVLEAEQIGPHDWRQLGALVAESPFHFLAALNRLDQTAAAQEFASALRAAREHNRFPQVIEWGLIDARKVTPIPPDHWLLVTENRRFRAALRWDNQSQHYESVEMQDGQHVAAFGSKDAFRKPREGKATLHLELYGSGPHQVTASLLFLPAQTVYRSELPMPLRPRGAAMEAPLALLTNGIGGMARIPADLGHVKSKYDCVLAANLHPSVPVDRHVFVKRIRVWANARHFINPLDGHNLQKFLPGPPARWEFAAIAGDGEVAQVELTAGMVEGSNTTVFRFRLLDGRFAPGSVRLTVRFDLEDRNFHSETRHNSGAEHHFSVHTHLLQEAAGFIFKPATDRQVRVSATSGFYHSSPEWSHGIPHPVEGTRGQVPGGDAFSPGWFDIPLESGAPVWLVVSADPNPPPWEECFALSEKLTESAVRKAGFPENDTFGRQLAAAAQAFIVRRDECKTVIAGYPWFLDWGRDSLICARGMISAGLIEEVKQLLVAFGRFEKDGTLPNTIHGEDASNRDTSDAPLWYGVVCEDLAAIHGPGIYDLPVNGAGRTVKDVLLAIAEGYRRGTPNGIKMDESSALVWSPSHFTWMDTNYPAGTPREGYPIEIQALWIKSLRQLQRILPGADASRFGELADRAAQSLQLFWLEENGWFSDVLLAASGVTAQNARPDDALRSNCVIPICFDLLPKDQARRCLRAVLRHLVIPGALRSLAPLPLKTPLPIHGADWRLLNNPHEPYWGRYEGDEDTQRKPAYHNGTAWTWTFPGFCEALARLWDFSPDALAAARAHLGSMAPLLEQECLGQIPEILDGDAPHQSRGCDAQAWGVTEALRVWKLLAG